MALAKKRAEIRQPAGAKKSNVWREVVALQFALCVRQLNGKTILQKWVDNYPSAKKKRDKQ